MSGDPRIAGDPQIQPLLEMARSYVSEFRYRDRLEGIPIHDEQGTYDRPYDLACLYKPSTINGLLSILGRKPWLAPRPRLVLFTR
ncbi:DUF2066 domain-containing protein [Pararhizobium sp. PWRC1-1]|uniref:DUF2066 domain-containing protein n=1 Tax=Pararhizobium sp. PWRC1-1 TaxID=2804566 RepID=UPI003CEE3EBC